MKKLREKINCRAEKNIFQKYDEEKDDGLCIFCPELSRDKIDNLFILSIQIINKSQCRSIKLV
jgi:hypothetical protein